MAELRTRHIRHTSCNVFEDIVGYFSLLLSLLIKLKLNIIKVFALRNDIFKVGEQLSLKVHVDKISTDNVYSQKNRIMCRT